MRVRRLKQPGRPRTKSRSTSSARPRSVIRLYQPCHAVASARPPGSISHTQLIDLLPEPVCRFRRHHARQGLVSAYLLLEGNNDRNEGFDIEEVSNVRIMLYQQTCNRRLGPHDPSWPAKDGTVGREQLVVWCYDALWEVRPHAFRQSPECHVADGSKALVG